MLLSLFLFLAGPVAAAPPVPAPPAAVLSGHLAHAPAGDTVRLQLGQKRYKAALSPSGDFRLVIQLPAATAGDLTYARQRTQIYLAPGYDVRLTLGDFRRFDETIVYSGRGAVANNYLAQAAWKFEYGPAADSLRPQARRTPATTPAEMRQLADEFRRRRLEFLAAYDKATPLPPALRRHAAAGIALDWGTQLLGFAGYYHQQAPGRPVVPAGYFDFVPQLPIADFIAGKANTLVDNDREYRLVNAYQWRLAPADTLGPAPAPVPRLYALAGAELGTPALRDQALYLLLNRKLETDLAGVAAAYPAFKAHNRDSLYARNLRTLLRLRVRLAVGQPAPAFALTDYTGQQVALADLRGKVVYLDFWGTWCPPCLVELTQHSHALKQQFAGRDVAFVYIAVNDPETKWRQVLANKQLAEPGSIHLYQPKGGAVAGDYLVNSFPTYWLIDRQGRIVDADAPRPSDGAKTVAAIERALAK
jgi:peroxiredoxin